MDLPQFKSLPEWEDRRFYQKGEEWKFKQEVETAKALYNQWREVFGLVSAYAEALPDEEDELLSARNLIYQNAYVVAPKIIAAAGDRMYQVKMENAALIRFNCRQMMEQIGLAVLMNKADEEHKEVINEALERFKETFRSWVTTFRKDEFEDDWGLFN